jgi:ribosome biogenesis GTPase
VSKKNTDSLIKGRVIRSTGSWYTVMSADNNIHDCRLRGKYRLQGLRTTNPVAVGDLVYFKIEPGKETGVIEQIKDRTNVIVRKSTNLSKAAHIIASNLDQALLVVTIDQPRTSTGFVDRFLATTEAYHLKSTLIFNKIDLYTPAQMEELRLLKNVYATIGYQVLEVSAETGQNLGQLKALMKDKVSLFSGHSGVGKSALINAIDSGLNIRIGDISVAHHKGKHTTTFAEMHPLSFGGWIIDTPGIKEFGLYDLEKETLAQRFPEMRKNMSECRFANCTHRSEPGCAIKQAVENGQIAAFRYKNYLNMMSDEMSD